MTEAHTAWTEEAIHQMTGDRLTYWDLPASAIMQTNPHKPRNWYPGGALQRITRADDPKVEYINVVKETMDNFINYAAANTGARDSPLELPPGYDSEDATWVAVEAFALAPMLVKGTVGELTGIEYTDAVLEMNLISLEEAAKKMDDVKDADALDENHGVDIAAMDGDELVTIQVKTSESGAENYDGIADLILIVDTETGEVDEW